MSDDVTEAEIVSFPFQDEGTRALFLAHRRAISEIYALRTMPVAELRKRLNGTKSQP